MVPLWPRAGIETWWRVRLLSAAAVRLLAASDAPQSMKQRANTERSLAPGFTRAQALAQRRHRAASGPSGMHGLDALDRVPERARSAAGKARCWRIQRWWNVSYFLRVGVPFRAGPARGAPPGRPLPAPPRSILIYQ